MKIKQIFKEKSLPAPIFKTFLNFWWHIYFKNQMSDSDYNSVPEASY